VAEGGPGVTQVAGEWYPPDEVVGQDEDNGVRRPGSGEDQPGQAERAEDLAGQRDGGHQPAVGRAAGHVEVEDPVQAEHHAESGEYLRCIAQWQPGQPEKPLRVRHRVAAPENVVRAGGEEDAPVRPLVLHCAGPAWVGGCGREGSGHGQRAARRGKPATA
jgi:hypothetical protein